MTGRSKRNTLVVGVVGLAIVAGLVLAAFNAQNLPLIGGGTTYAAEFTEAGGLRVDDEVRAAGVKVGEVRDLELAGDRVRIEFQISNEELRLGRKTGAAIKIRTVLGRKYLELHPQGTGHLDPDRVIPASRTVAPYDVVNAFSDLTETTEEIDTEQLATALGTLSETFADTPKDVRESLDGLSRLSKVIAERDQEIQRLLKHANQVTKVLSDRNEDLVELFENGSLLFEEVRKRRELIHQLLVNAQDMSRQLRGLVRDNEKQLRPALNRLNSVVDMLERNQEDLDASIEALAPFTRVFANTTGTGPWFDAYLPNLAPLPATPQLPTDGGER